VVLGSSRGPLPISLSFRRSAGVPERPIEDQAREYAFTLKVEQALAGKAGFSWEDIVDLMFWAYNEGMSDH
jgi:hypothetical protein